LLVLFFTGPSIQIQRWFSFNLGDFKNPEPGLHKSEVTEVSRS